MERSILAVHTRGNKLLSTRSGRAINACYESGESGMPATIIYGNKNTLASSALVEGDNLWLSNVELTRATGWELKPQGACLGDRCVPIRAGRGSEFVRPGLFNLSALARHLGKPIVHDEQHAVWS